MAARAALEVSAAAFELSLPTATLDAARPDWRICVSTTMRDTRCPTWWSAPGRRAKSSKRKVIPSIVNGTITVLTLETGLSQPIVASRWTPQPPRSSRRFRLKVQLTARRADTGHGAADLSRSRWRQPTDVAIPVGVWPWLRLTVMISGRRRYRSLGRAFMRRRLSLFPAEAVPDHHHRARRESWPDSAYHKSRGGEPGRGRSRDRERNHCSPGR